MIFGNGAEREDRSVRTLETCTLGWDPVTMGRGPITMGNPLREGNWKLNNSEPHDCYNRTFFFHSGWHHLIELIHTVQNSNKKAKHFFCDVCCNPICRTEKLLRSTIDKWHSRPHSHLFNVSLWTDHEEWNPTGVRLTLAPRIMVPVMAIIPRGSTSRRFIMSVSDFLIT